MTRAKQKKEKRKSDRRREKQVWTVAKGRQERKQGGDCDGGRDTQEREKKERLKKGKASWDRGEKDVRRETVTAGEEKKKEEKERQEEKSKLGLCLEARRRTINSVFHYSCSFPSLWGKRWRNLESETNI